MKMHVLQFEPHDTNTHAWLQKKMAELANGDVDVRRSVLNHAGNGDRWNVNVRFRYLQTPTRPTITHIMCDTCMMSTKRASTPRFPRVETGRQWYLRFICTSPSMQGNLCRLCWPAIYAQKLHGRDGWWDSRYMSLAALWLHICPPVYTTQGNTQWPAK